ncbi:hypothetical protein [Xanthomonas translucens]|uniref:hypothetical protein n=1 Tax=Xanthomonas campestris pv. translucens TaxID=343 RepID=UPI001E5C1035|nr:hypothetical protein [Xanthomonas translucens]WKZ99554.1 hypothetical protein MO330_11635 [Xanthomonas translucens]
MDKLRFIVLMLVTIASLGACSKQEEVNPPQQTSGNSDAASSASRSNAGEHARPNQHSDHITADRAVASRVTVEDYLCKDGPRCQSAGALVARTPEEAQWLMQHGYPTREESKRLESATLDQLKAEADAGSKPALIVYGKKLAIGPDYAAGFSILQRVAQEGNLYAYYGLSEVYEKSNVNPSLVDSAAFLRVAYLLGDSKASSEIAAKGLSSVENVAIDERAAGLYKTFAKQRQPMPRPI